MHKISNRWPHQDSLKVEWNIGKRCNFDCSYCPSEIHDNHSPHTDITILKNTIDKLYEIGKPLRISFTGGEPCVHPQISHLFEYTRNYAAWINVTTNGTRTAEWYAKQTLDHIVFSLHFETDDWSRCLQNILDTYELVDIPIQVNVMAHHNHMENVKTAVEMLETRKIKYVIRRIRWTEKHDWFDDMRYDAEDLDWILSREATSLPNCEVDGEYYIHANDIIKKHQNQFKGWKCNIGLESLMVNWNGEVHRATCRVGGSLGNIYTGSFQIPSNPINCTREWCTCAADIPITKTIS
jgi:MoaA/NifB/PqqE/SkfB family radical SAM enzyme